MRKLLATLLLAIAPFAAEARQYAILSLVGDELTIVQREMATGSRIDKNTQLKVPLGGASLDRAMLLAVDEAVRKADPSARPVLLAPRDPKLFEVAARSLDGGGTAAVFEAVKPVAAKANATHLILITKHRHRAMLRLSDGHVGDGVLEGLGFYVDHGSATRGSGAMMGDVERGFISPYTYFKVAVIEMSSGRIVAEDYVVGSHAHQVEAGAIGNAWKLLTDEQKDAEITKLIRQEVARVVPMVLAKG
ncbi:MAG: hypothetical protein ABIQ72_03585 [Usitatibacter sp.]